MPIRPVDPKHRLLTEFFGICQDLKEVIEDHRNWHVNGNHEGCTDPNCKIDPLWHQIIDLNVRLAVTRKKAEDAGVEIKRLLEIENFFGLRKKGRGKAT